jgi:hypothetical protein
MPENAPDYAAAFARLERQLFARRLAAIEPVLRVEIAALGALAAAFLFWQMRLRLDTIGFARGAWAAAGESALALLALALAGAAVAGARHAVRLRGGFPGPHWLVLPIPPRAIHRHLSRTSGAPALWAALPAAAVLIAGVGVVPAPALPALAIGFALALAFGGRTACAIASRVALAGSTQHPGLDPETSVLAVATRPPRAPRLGAARWRRESALAAFLRKDLLLIGRPGPARRALVAPLLLGALSVAVWALPLAREARPVAALALALLAASGVASWIVALTASDPFAIVRVLPLGVGVVWGARVLWAALGAVMLGAGQALAAGFADGHAPAAFLAGVALPALAIGLLGANYAVTLFPRADHAERILSIVLAISVAGSLMFPLLGWALLLAALLHSARRLPRWATREPA